MSSWISDVMRSSADSFSILRGILVLFPLIVSVSIFIRAIAVAYASFKIYDVLVRDWLRKKLFKAA